MSTSICTSISMGEDFDVYKDSSHYGIHDIMDYVKRGPRWWGMRHITDEIGDDDDTEAKRFGRLAHAVILEGGTRELTEFAITPAVTYDAKGVEKPWSMRTQHAKDWVAEQTGTVVSRADWDLAEAMRRSVRGHKCSTILNRMVPELVLRGQINGFLIQCRVDAMALSENGIPDCPMDWIAACDLKTITNVNQAEHDILKLGYHIQAAFYLDLIAEAGGECPFLLCFVEKSRPYRVRWIELDDAWLAAGRREYRKALKGLTRCYDQWLNGAAMGDAFPLHTTELEVLEAPHWMEEA